MEKVVHNQAGADSPPLGYCQGETGMEGTRVGRSSPKVPEARAVVAVDCGAIPDTLIESELFGYEKGAFTGADQRQEGGSGWPTEEAFSSTRLSHPLPPGEAPACFEGTTVQPLGNKQPVEWTYD